MANKLVRVANKAYIGGTPAVPYRPAYCYTEQGVILEGGYSEVTDGRTSSVTLQLLGVSYDDPIAYCLPERPYQEGTPATVVETGGGPDWRGAARSVDKLAGDATASLTFSAEGGVIVGFSKADTGANLSDILMGAYVQRVSSTLARAYLVLNGEQQPQYIDLPAQGRITLTRAGGRFTVSGPAPGGGSAVMGTAANTTDDVYLEAHLYTTADYVEDPVLAAAEAVSLTGSVGFDAGLSSAVGVAGSVGLGGQVGTLVDGVAVQSVAGSVGFTAAVSPVESVQVSLAGSVGFSGTAAFADANAMLTLSPMELVASDFAQAQATLTLSPMTMEATATGISAGLTGADLSLSSLSMSAVSPTGELIDGELTLSGMTLYAADREYATLQGALSPMTMYADSGFSQPNFYGYAEPLGLADSYLLDPALFATWVDNMDMQPSLSLATLLTGSMFDGLILDPSLSVQDYLYALIESGINLSSATQLPRPELAQYAFDAVSGAATRYDGFDFVDFVHTDEGTFAVKADGLYRLRRGDDDGAERSALVDFGDTAFGTSKAKHIHTMYLGLGGDGTAYVKLSADGKAYKTYRVRGQRPTKRVHTGKGITAREWGLRLEWVDATSVELESVEFVLAGSSRRWTR